MALTGFKFLVSENGATRWAFIQGSGGRFGDGSLHVATDAINILHVEVKLIGKVRDELRSAGFLREWVDAEDPKDRIRKITPDKVDGVSAVWSDGEGCTR